VNAQPNTYETPRGEIELSTQFYLALSRIDRRVAGYVKTDPLKAALW
jgi:hypothetical protein